MNSFIKFLLIVAFASFLSCDRDNPVKPTDELKGRLVFFTGDSTVGPMGIYTMNLDGSELRAVAVAGDTIRFPGPWGDKFILDRTGSGRAWYPRWSPDGKKIVCELNWAADASVIMLMNADGSNKHVLWKVRSSALRPQWSPEGDKFLFMRAGYLGAIFALGIVDTSGENDRDFRVLDGSPILFEGDSLWANWDFQWGPTGSTLYGSHTVNGPPGNVVGNNPHNEIFSFDSRTGVVLQRLTRNTIDEGSFQLSPDGVRVAFRRGLYNVPDNRFYVLSLSSISIDSILLNAPLGLFNWSTDGSKLIYELDENPNTWRTKFYIYMLDVGKPVDRRKLMHFQASEPDLFIPRRR